MPFAANKLECGGFGRRRMLRALGSGTVLLLLAEGCSDKESMDGTMIENPKEIQDILSREPAKSKKSAAAK